MTRDGWLASVALGGIAGLLTFTHLELARTNGEVGRTRTTADTQVANAPEHLIPQWDPIDDPPSCPTGAQRDAQWRSCCDADLVVRDPPPPSRRPPVERAAAPDARSSKQTRRKRVDPDAPWEWIPPPMVSPAERAEIVKRVEARSDLRPAPNTRFR
jgi:hypothetical protein